MATELLMPKLGLTMEAGTIIEWLAADGDAVAAGSAVLRIETDKVESDVEAVESGLLHRLGDVGESYECGQVIGYLLTKGEDPPTVSSAAAPAAPMSQQAAVAGMPQVAAVADQGAMTDGRRLLASPNARRVAAERGTDIATVIGSGPGGRIVSRDVLESRIRPDAPMPAETPTPTTPWPRTLLPATAAARQLADLLGLDLATVPVDPRDGRVTRESVAVHIRGLLAGAARTADPDRAEPGSKRTPSPTSRTGTVTTSAPLTQTPTEIVAMTGMRATIAKRMHSSLRDMAQLTLSMDADMDAVVADRNRRMVRGPAPGFSDYVVAAAARALREHPLANSQVVDEGIALLPDVHVGLAVAVDNGLMVPVVRDTASLDLDALSAETTRLALAAREGRLTLPEIEGATFSVSILGMFGVDGFTPVINPPNVAILGAGRVRDDVVLVDEAPRPVKRLTLSLTWDHRVLDGAPAAAFCQSIVRLLGRPELLDTKH